MIWGERLTQQQEQGEQTAGGVARRPALRMLREQGECDLGRRGRQGPGLTAPGSHQEMGRLQTSETKLERKNQGDEFDT